jgi:hypothetical protein
MIFEKVDSLMQQLVGKENHRHQSHVIRQLFNLHNEVFPNQLEYSVGCGSCRKRVYTRLKDWWLKQGGVKKT